MLARNADAVIAQRTGDFRAITPDGIVHDAREMADATRNLLANLQKWEALSYDIVGVEQHGDEVSADIVQHTIRLQRRSDGNIHRVENMVKQRETWLRTAAGLKVRRVDNIRDQKVLIDGLPR
jgi:very-short-patch-repair endonuclease